MARIVDVPEFTDPTGRFMVARYPEHGQGDIITWSQLIVRDSQWAVFFKDGKALDVFESGRYTINESLNFPLIHRLYGWVFDGKSPFRCEVYFVSRMKFTDLRWGTKEPVTFRDSVFSMIRLRAYGRYVMQIVDPTAFVNEIVGTRGRFSSDDIQDFLRDIIVSRLNDLLGESVKTLLDLPAQYDELAQELQSRCADDFQRYGLKLENLYLMGVNPPEEVQQKIDERAGMGAVGNLDQYMKFKAASALEKAAENPGGAGEGMGMGMGAGMGFAMMGNMMRQMGGGTVPEGTAACGACGAALIPGAKFCAKCGTPVSAGPAAEEKNGKFCVGCGSKLPGDAKFCSQCGTEQP